MAIIPDGTYKACHARTFQGESQPAYVRRTFYDDQQRRCHQILAVCNSAGIDNNAMVDAIAESLNERQT